MTMPKISIALVATLVAGLAIGALAMRPADEPAAEPGPVQPVPDFDADAGIEQRLLALESAVSAEREARQLLEDELLALYEELDSLGAAVVDETDEAAAMSAAEARELIRQQQGLQNRVTADGRSQAERRVERLTTAGFSPARAEWIIQRESELRMEAMQARFEAMRTGEPNNPILGANPDSMLRDEIGDSEYEMYLRANNRPVNVGVAAVFDSSPAQAAGLQPGDEITHYDGNRVFSGLDLTRQAIAGDAGETVVVNIVRGGIPMQVAIPRGPLGVNIGGRR